MPGVRERRRAAAAAALCMLATAVAIDARAATPAAGATGGMTADLGFYKRIAADGTRLGPSDVHVIGPRREVVACLDVGNVPVGRLQAVHLIWVNPQGREIFRKYAEVTIRPAAGGGYEAHIVWRRADMPNARETVVQRSDSAGFSLLSKLSLAPERNRAPGRHMLRVFRHRALWLERGFELSPAPILARLDDPDAADLRAQLTFCARADAQSGCRSAPAARFERDRQKGVFACLSVEGAVPGRLYAVDLVWRDPQGREIFRKLADVAVAPADSGFSARIVWRQDRDLDEGTIEESATATPGFVLVSRLSLTAGKERPSGRYRVQALLAQSPLVEAAFELAEAEPSPPSAGSAPKSDKRRSGRAAGGSRRAGD